MKRRDLFAMGGGAVLLASARHVHGLANSSFESAGSVVIATWDFGLPASKEAFHILNLPERAPLDAVEAGIRVTEADVNNRTVGVGGLPNAEGEVQLDACIMDGDRQKSGSVAALKGFAHPISVARRVMETTPHVMLVGEDAARFAESHSFEKAAMPVPEARADWLKWKADREGNAKSLGADRHDTIALLVRRSDGKLAGGCSTSGLSFKLPGRVGDSPIIGSGLYVDGRVGAAGATGIGENILRYCGSFLVVEMMRNGLSPGDACRRVVERIIDGEQRPASELHVNFIAVNRDGEWGAAGTAPDFVFGLVTNDRSEVVQAQIIS